MAVYFGENSVNLLSEFGFGADKVQIKEIPLIFAELWLKFSYFRCQGPKDTVYFFFFFLFIFALLKIMLQYTFRLNVGDRPGFRNSQNPSRYPFFKSGFHRQHTLIFNNCLADFVQEITLPMRGQGPVEVFLNGFSGKLYFVTEFFKYRGSLTFYIAETVKDLVNLVNDLLAELKIFYFSDQMWKSFGEIRQELLQSANLGCDVFYFDKRLRVQAEVFNYHQFQLIVNIFKLVKGNDVMTFKASKKFRSFFKGKFRPVYRHRTEFHNTVLRLVRVCEWSNFG